MSQDEKLTAYALNQLSGQEKEDFENLLKQNPEWQKEIDEIREFAGEISKELTSEECPELSDAQRQKVLAKVAPKKTPLIPFALTAAAALLAVGIYVSNKHATEVAKDHVVKNELKGTQAKDPIKHIKQYPNGESKSESELSVKAGNTGNTVVDTQSLVPDMQPKADLFAIQSKDIKFSAEAQSVKELGRSLNKVDYEYAAKRLRKKSISHPGFIPSDAIPIDRRFLKVEGNTERYGSYMENPFGTVVADPLSTFSIDVDTASYANVRRKLMNGYLPHKDAVRIEEMINYFDYDYPQPEAGKPFSVNTEVADCPWTEGNKIVRIGLHGRDVKVDKRPPANLVFLIDVSGSMSSSDKLPLLKEGFQKMVAQLNEKDRVGIVVYASNTGVVLEPTICDQKGKDLIIGALARLNAGGSTNGEGGIKQAYELVNNNFIAGGTNRVILATDGDFNVGVSSNKGLIDLVQEKAKKKAYLTVLGFGQGNLNDHMMEEISNKGNGNYFYIDSAKESTRVLCSKISSTLVTIAKDVKIQIEFNPALVHSYRLIGYDNRMLKHEDFNNDKKDAGEIGAGHNVTALYEIVPVGAANARKKIDDLKYQTTKEATEPVKAATREEFKDELLTVKLRYKSPEGGASILMKQPLKKSEVKFTEASKGFIFTSAVASFGMLLKGSEHAGDASYEDIIGWLNNNKVLQANEDREEFLKLVQIAEGLKKK